MIGTKDACTTCEYGVSRGHDVHFLASHNIPYWDLPDHEPETSWREPKRTQGSECRPHRQCLLPTTAFECTTATDIVL